MQQLEHEIENVDSKIHHSEMTLKDLRKLQEEIATKTAQRSTLFKEQQRQYAALSEDIQGLPIDMNLTIVALTLLCLRHWVFFFTISWGYVVTTHYIFFYIFCLLYQTRMKS